MPAANENLEYDDPQSQMPEDYTLREKIRNLDPLLAAGALPFAGRIGWKPNIHADKGELLNDINEFRKRVRAGDILISGSQKISPQQMVISLASGNPKGYHIAVMDRNRSMREHGMGPEEGHVMSDLDLADWKKDNLQILRPKDPAHAKLLVRRAREMSQATVKMQRIIQKNLIQKGYSPTEAEKLSYIATSKLYRWGQGIRSGIEHTFMPKVDAEHAALAQAKKHIEHNKRLVDNAGAYATSMAEKLHELRQNELANLTPFQKLKDRLYKKSPMYKKVVDLVPGLTNSLGLHPSHASIGKYNELRNIIPSCAGGVCSSVPALQGERQIVSGKSPLNTMPSDYLKSDLFTSVARYQGGARKDNFGRMIHSFLEKGPSAMRVGASLGIAGLGYAGLKRHLERTQEIENKKRELAQTAMVNNQTI